MKSKELEFILRCSCSYTESIFEHDNRFKNLLFKESGKNKLGNCLGIISGLYFAGDIIRAEVLASEFIKNLSYLNQSGDDIDVEDNGCKFKTPCSVRVLVDDGTTFGFGLGWYHYVKKEKYHNDLSTEQKNRCIEYGLWKQKYIFFMNGGLIFHGWNSDRTGFREASQLKDCFGVHT